MLANGPHATRPKISAEIEPTDYRVIALTRECNGLPWIPSENHVKLAASPLVDHTSSNRLDEQVLRWVSSEEKKKEKEKQEEYIRTAGEESDKYIVIVFLILMSNLSINRRILIRDMLLVVVFSCFFIGNSNYALCNEANFKFLRIMKVENCSLQ